MHNFRFHKYKDFLKKIDPIIFLVIYIALIWGAAAPTNFFLIITPSNLIFSLGILTFPILLMFLSYEENKDKKLFVQRIHFLLAALAHPLIFCFTQSYDFYPNLFDIEELSRKFKSDIAGNVDWYTRMKSSYEISIAMKSNALWFMRYENFWIYWFYPPSLALLIGGFLVKQIMENEENSSDIKLS